MASENLLTVTLARLARVPFALRTPQPFTPPRKALILLPCCLSQVMLATPLLAALSETYPQARFDWAVGDWARPAVAGNPRLTRLIRIGASNLHQLDRSERRDLIRRLREEAYDTCFIPSRSSLLAYVAWRAGIPQRVGINDRGRGFAHTLAVPLPETDHATETALALARAAGVPEETLASVEMEFYPADRERTAVVRRLVEEVDWLGDVPLVLLHPGGGDNPVFSDTRKRWPVERFARLGNHLVRQYDARLAVVGTEADRPLAAAIDGMTAAKVANLAGRLSLGELGAMCEVADLYVGNDTGTTHVAAATGCPTLALFGPSDPAHSRPYVVKGRVTVLRPDLGDAWEERPFSWDLGATADEAMAAADALLRAGETAVGSSLHFLANSSENV